MKRNGRLTNFYILVAGVYCIFWVWRALTPDYIIVRKDPDEERIKAQLLKDSTMHMEHSQLKAEYLTLGNTP